MNSPRPLTGWVIHLFKASFSKCLVCSIRPCNTTFLYDNRLFSQNGQVNENRSFTLSGVLDRVSPFGKDTAWMDEALRGLLTQPVQNFDSSFTPEITNKLFR